MKKKIADKWIKALESGHYKKCKGQLQKRNNYCCLGVLTDLYIQEKGFEAFKHCDVNNDGTIIGGILNKAVQKWAGMKSQRGNLFNKSNSNYNALTSLNDTYNYSFKQIADVIKKNWRKL